MKDLIILVPDKNAKFGIEGLLSRFNALQIRKILYDIYIHPLHDPGVYKNASDILRPFINQYSFSLVLFDREGSGQENKDSKIISSEVKAQLERNGWEKRVEVIVFDPELEIWVWTESQYVATVLGWNNYSELKRYLVSQHLWNVDEPKPKRPKEAVETSLRKKRIPRSSSIYKDIAENVEFERCQDKSFNKLKNILQQWFP